MRRLKSPLSHETLAPFHFPLSSFEQLIHGKYANWCEFECVYLRSVRFNYISHDRPSLNDIFMSYTPLVGSILHEPVSGAD